MNTTNSNLETYDCVVIGGGLAGLTAAATLAGMNRSVLLLERHPVLGGRGRSDDRDGWIFNQGGHALYKEGIGRGILQGLGVDPAGEEPPLDGAQFSEEGVVTPLPFGPMAVAKTRSLSVRGKVEFAGLMTRLPKLDPDAYNDVSVDAWLSEYRPDVAAAVKAIVRLTTYCVATDLLSAGAAIEQLQLSFGGVLYLNGGWAAMVADLATVAERLGAGVHTDVAVESVQVRTKVNGKEDGFTIVTETSTIYSRTVVVAAGGPAHGAKLLGLQADTFAHAGPAPEAAVLDLSLNQLPSKHRFILGLDEPTYFSVNSPPATGEVAAVAMRYLGPDDKGDAASHRSSLEKIATLAGATDVTDARFLRRMTVTYGLPLATQGGLAGRPGVVIEQLPGAYLAGDWVGDRALLADASIASGQTAAQEVASTLDGMRK